MNTRTNYFKVVTCVPKVYPGQPVKNAELIIEALKCFMSEKVEDNPDLIVFPEMCITGYTCGDLFLTDDLWESTKLAIDNIYDFLCGERSDLTVILGAPMKSGNGSLWNCGIVLNCSESRNPVYVYPKKNLPEYSEFYEKRWFKEGPTEESEFTLSEELHLQYSLLPGGVLSIGGVMVGLEICEDLWVPNPPCCELVTEGGAEIIVNISASPDLTGKTEYLKDLLRATSGRLVCAYVYVSAGPWESTTDLVFSGNQYVFENGKLLAEGRKPETLQQDLPLYTISEIDLDEIRGYRRKSKTVLHGSYKGFKEKHRLQLDCPQIDGWIKPGTRILDPHPFLKPENYEDVLRIQSLGLQKRIMACGGPKCKCIIGVSGGSDSTWALLVVADAYQKLGFSSKNIIGVTMPCFGTSSRTKGNSWKLMELLGVDGREICIKDSVTAHLKELGHPLDVYDIAYENAQARMRTQTLFNLSNMEGGLVIGTGDLSELALGWCTYGADHLSSYNVNVSIPKTLIKALIGWKAEKEDQALRDVLFDILGTPVSPELLPLDENGEIAQVSEDNVGPYELHDYFLYHFLRTGMGALKMAYTCFWAFSGKYDLKTIKFWERKFFWRFGSQQFKRSCLPDGPKVGSVSLSPRGDWRMPSDVSMEEYVKALEENE